MNSLGYGGIKTVLAGSRGQKVEANVDTGVYLITKENMNNCHTPSHAGRSDEFIAG